MNSYYLKLRFLQHIAVILKGRLLRFDLIGVHSYLYLRIDYHMHDCGHRAQQVFLVAVRNWQIESLFGVFVQSPAECSIKSFE